MPVIVSCFASVGEDVAGWDHIIGRSNRVNGMDIAVPSAVYLPTGGMGFFGWPAICGHRQGRDFIIGPTSWDVSQSDDRLTLTGKDTVAKLSLQLDFEMRGPALLQMRTAITNDSTVPYSLDRCMAGTIHIPGGARLLHALHGSWGREFHITPLEIGGGLWMQESRRGRTSHDKFPGGIIESASGVAYQVHLGWSGNHVIAVDRLDDGQSLVHLGELFEPGEVTLAPGETYLSPVLYAACELNGNVADLAPVFHAALRKSVVSWPGGSMKPRPVIMNTWEGTYFRHDVENLKAQATAAAALGIERFVLDDGWFGKRDSDNAALGDWFVDPRKYPQGLKPLIDHVKSLGMEFGIWIEPEMVSPDSSLFSAHPDWALQMSGRPLLLSRHQLVLDLTRPEVSDHLFARIDALLSNHAISYLKWDMNRDLTHPGDREGRAATSRQTRAVYALMDRVRQAHPSVEIESCASGGGRADYGVLRYTHRIWTSDCTDALERLEIQRGARLFFPPEIIGCHISSSPNHQTQRRHTLSFRAIVAFFGHLGIELDPLTLSDEERMELRDWIELHKALRRVLHHPDSMSFDLPVVDGRRVFGVGLSEHGSDEEHVILAVAQGEQTMREQPEPVRITVYHSDRLFTVKRLGPGEPPFVRSVPSQSELMSSNLPVLGSWLREPGLPIPQLYPQSAILVEIKTVKANPHG
jgi:alpha-galactosidase